jgi:hypothetical protein
MAAFLVFRIMNIYVLVIFIIWPDMVKNKGFLPSGPSEIAIQRKQIKEIIFSLLPACKDADPDTGIPFKVDAIIANPPAYGQNLYALLYSFCWSSFMKTELMSRVNNKERKYIFSWK